MGPALLLDGHHTGYQSGASRLEVELAAARVELAHVREQITGMQNQAAVDVGVGTRLQYEVDELKRQMAVQTDAHTRQLEARDEVAAQLARTAAMEKVFGWKGTNPSSALAGCCCCCWC